MDLTQLISRRVNISSCALLWALLLTIFEGARASLQAYGCEVGWTNYQEHCYNIVLKDTVADQAKNDCTSLGASLSSVWSPEEKDFIMSLWQYPDDELGFLWLGLRGAAFNAWEYDDKSKFDLKIDGENWTLLKDVPGVPGSTSNKCVALRSSGSLAFLDCSMSANAYVCKKALPKVFITASLLNHTQPVAVSPMGHVQLFERMFPPVLTSLPSQSSRLAEASVATEVGCAFRCYSVTGCQVFQVSCETSRNCDAFQCVLFSDFIS